MLGCRRRLRRPRRRAGRCVRAAARSHGAVSMSHGSAAQRTPSSSRCTWWVHACTLLSPCTTASKTTNNGMGVSCHCCDGCRGERREHVSLLWRGVSGSYLCPSPCAYGQITWYACLIVLKSSRGTRQFVAWVVCTHIQTGKVGVFDRRRVQRQASWQRIYLNLNAGVECAVTATVIPGIRTGLVTTPNRPKHGLHTQQDGSAVLRANDFQVACVCGSLFLMVVLGATGKTYRSLSRVIIATSCGRSPDCSTNQGFSEWVCAVDADGRRRAARARTPTGAWARRTS